MRDIAEGVSDKGGGDERKKGGHRMTLIQQTIVEVGRMLAETSHPCLRVHGCAWFMVPDTLFTHDSLI